MLWIEEHGIATRWTDQDEAGKTRSYESFRPVNSKDISVIDSILEIQKSIVKFNLHSNYTKAIEAVKDESPFINLYHTYVTNAGMVDSSIMFSGIKDNKLDISRPVERRVLVLHLVY